MLLIILTLYSMLAPQYTFLEAKKLIFFFPRILNRKRSQPSPWCYKQDFFFYYLSAAIGNRERVRVLSKLAHGDILGGGNGKIMSYRNSKARILTSCQTAAMLASTAW